MRESIAGHEIDIQDTGAPRGERNYWQVLLNGQAIYEGHNGAQAQRTYRAVSEGLKRAAQPAAGNPVALELLRQAFRLISTREPEGVAAGLDDPSKQAWWYRECNPTAVAIAEYLGKNPAQPTAAHVDCPDRALKKALFACTKAGGEPRTYGGVLTKGGYAWVRFTVEPAARGADHE